MPLASGKLSGIHQVTWFQGLASPCPCHPIESREECLDIRLQDCYALTGLFPYFCKPWALPLAILLGPVGAGKAQWMWLIRHGYWSIQVNKIPYKIDSFFRNSKSKPSPHPSIIFFLLQFYVSEIWEMTRKTLLLFVIGWCIFIVLASFLKIQSDIPLSRFTP